LSGCTHTARGSSIGRNAFLFPYRIRSTIHSDNTGSGRFDPLRPTTRAALRPAVVEQNGRGEAGSTTTRCRMVDDEDSMPTLTLLAAAARPVPWRVDAEEDRDGFMITDGQDAYVAHADDWDTAAFLVAARAYFTD